MIEVLDPTRRSTMASTVHPGSASRGYVLVVEDDRPTRELLATILAGEGMRCHTTSNGHEAMDQARREAPAVVVLDVHLPTVQGDAVATALRIEFGHRLPVLVMSASFEAPLAERMAAFGYLQKPFEVDEFLTLVQRGFELAAMTPAARPMEDAMRRQREAFDRARVAHIEPVSQPGYPAYTQLHA
jgi:DNA-binding NtrC family response regulator